MKVTGFVKDKTLYIALSGEMDECSSQEARTKCDKLIEDNLSVSKIIINLADADSFVSQIKEVRIRYD